MIRFIIHLISTLLFIGYIPWAPGTFGSLPAIIVWTLLRNRLKYVIFIIAVLPLSFVSSDYAEKKIFSRKDPPQIVIDEFTGMLFVFSWISFSPTFQGIMIGIAGFVLFRILDITKPLLISWVQYINGGKGIMLDDIIAGIITCGFLHLALFMLK